MKLDFIQKFIRQQSAGRPAAIPAPPGPARNCLHCQGQHSEDYLCPELLYAHGLPSRAAIRHIQIRAR